MDYDAALEFLGETKEMLEDTVDTPDDPEVHGQALERLKTLNNIIDFVTAARDRERQESGR